MNPLELHHHETLYTPVYRPPLPFRHVRPRLSGREIPTCHAGFWSLTTLPTHQRVKKTESRSIARTDGQAVMPSAGLPDCLAFRGGRVVSDGTKIPEQRTQLFLPDVCSIAESFPRTPSTPEKPAPHIGAGHLSQVSLVFGRWPLVVLEQKCLGHTSRGSPVDQCPALGLGELHALAALDAASRFRSGQCVLTSPVICNAHTAAKIS